MRDREWGAIAGRLRAMATRTLSSRTHLGTERAKSRPINSSRRRVGWQSRRGFEVCPRPAKPSSQALHTLLQTQSAPVLRGEVLPERVPAAGLLILRDGDPGEPAVTLSPLCYHYQHRAEVEAVVQAGTGRDAALDALAAGVGTASGSRPHARRALRLGRGRGAAAGRPRHRRRGDAQGSGHPDRAALCERRSARLNGQQVR